MNSYRSRLISLIFFLFVGAAAIGQTIGSPGSTVTVLGKLAVKKSDTTTSLPDYIWAFKGDTLVKYRTDSLLHSLVLDNAATITFNYGFIPSQNPYDPFGENISLLIDTTSPDGLATKNDLTTLSNSGAIDFIVKYHSNAPVGGDADGEKYLVGTSPTGAFASHANSVATKVGVGSYTFTVPTQGQQLIVDNPATHVYETWLFNGSAWGQSTILVRVNLNTLGASLPLGTTDSNDVVILTNSLDALRIAANKKIYVKDFVGARSHNLVTVIDTTTGELGTVVSEPLAARSGITIEHENDTTFLSATGGGGSQDLQSVTDIGNSTTNDIDATNDIESHVGDISHGVYTGYSYDDGEVYQYVNGLRTMGVLSHVINMFDPTNSSQTQLIFNDAPSDFVQINFPNTSGNVATSVDGVAAGSDGDVVLHAVKTSDTASMLSPYLRTNVAAATYEVLSNKQTTLDNSATHYPSTSAVTTALATKQDAFTETVERFTGSTSTSLTTAHTPLSSKAEIVFFNGVAFDPSNVIITGTSVTISGITRETSDVITIKYSY